VRIAGSGFAVRTSAIRLQPGTVVHSGCFFNEQPQIICILVWILKQITGIAGPRQSGLRYKDDNR